MKYQGVRGYSSAAIMMTSPRRRSERRTPGCSRTPSVRRGDRPSFGRRSTRAATTAGPNSLLRIDCRCTTQRTFVTADEFSRYRAIDLPGTIGSCHIDPRTPVLADLFSGHRTNDSSGTITSLAARTACRECQRIRGTHHYGGRRQTQHQFRSHRTILLEQETEFDGPGTPWTSSRDAAMACVVTRRVVCINFDRDKSLAVRTAAAGLCRFH